ncbi:MAG TPA: phospholipase D-like domain-containing protein [Polyangiaceae bacterium]|nr:phospholipase D-like domain-containing protein [Polyangiaceae bacterium]
MKPIVDMPRNVFATAQADQSALLIDACVYYQTVYRALEGAQHYAVLSGWQFDSGVPLLRGEDAERATRPVTLLKFLHALCEERPELTIYLLAWDFSVAYLSEREWMQGLKFTYSTNPRVRFEWDEHPVAGASHHQKFVVVDGAVGFLGGIDICDARWDECDHRQHNPQRVNLAGEPCKPYHDVQAALTGDAVRPLVDVFVERWQRATGDRLQLGVASAEARSRFDLAQLSNGHAQPIGCSQVSFSRTQQDERAEPAEVAEIRELVSDALQAAERLVYAETQYFTSRSIAAVLLDRMKNDQLPKLEIVLCMPHGADSPKEKMALGDTQEAILYALRETALQTGHELRLLYSATCTDDGGEIPTFIHAKLLIVDDQFLMVGSPNLTERSMGLDTELAVTWYRDGDIEDPDTRDCVRNVRTRLLAEHAGVDAKEFEIEAGLCAKIDALIASGKSRLRHRAIQSFGPLGPWMAEIFDPADGILKDAPLNGSESALGRDGHEHGFISGIQGFAARLQRRERAQ